MSAEEGFQALYCLVEWGDLKEEEAWFMYDHIGSFAGDDGEVSLDELKQACEGM